jgi:hypothetical protein
MLRIFFWGYPIGDMGMYMKQPREIGQLSKDTGNRMVALSSLFLLVACAFSARLGLVPFYGPVMASVVAAACIASVYLISDRTTYLPFLGEAVLPGSLIRDDQEPADATIEVEVHAEPGATKVAYWASDVGTGVKKNPWIAYGTYTNSGVAQVRGGKATLRLRCPAIYTVRGKVLPRHVHYRSVFPSGIVGKIETRGVVCT